LVLSRQAKHPANDMLVRQCTHELDVFIKNLPFAPYVRERSSAPSPGRMLTLKGEHGTPVDI